MKVIDMWEDFTLGEITEITGGGTPSRKNPEYFKGDIIWLTPSQIDREKIIHLNDSEERITQPALENSSARIVPAGTILFTSRASIGYIAIADKSLATNQGFANFYCYDKLHNLFLAYWLKYKTNLIKSIAKGTTFKEISKSALKELSILVPPLEEQKLIVAKIEEFFSQLDASQASLERACANLHRYRQSLLKAAFSGELTREWRKEHEHELEPASQLLDRIIQGRKDIFNLSKGKKNQSKKNSYMSFKNESYGLSDQWIWVSLSQISEIILGQSPPSSTYNTNHQGLPFFQGKAEFSNRYPIPVKWCSAPKKIAMENDILISVRAPVGPINICNQESCIGRGLAAIRPEKDISYLYLFYYFKSIENEWGHKSTGTTFSAISGNVLKSTRIPLASFKEQTEIVKRLEMQDSIINYLDQVIIKNLRKNGLFKKSILEKAFSGKLV